MKISGLQKLTLLDFPGKVSCIVFFNGCNLRCPYCHNASLVTHLSDDYISEDEFFEFLDTRKGKLDGVVITGGEPTLRAGLIPFMKKIKDKGFLIKLDTNGTNPKKLEEIIKLGLVDYVAMDFKNSKNGYSKTVGGKEVYDLITRSMNILKTSSVLHEFRTTVVKEFHSYEDLEEIAQTIAPDDWYLQQFVDSGDLIGNGMSSYSDEVLKSYADKLNVYTKCHTRGI